MKVLWLCNVPHPYICENENISQSAGGKWIDSLYENLKGNEDFELVYLFPYSRQLEGNHNGIKYYSFRNCSNSLKIKTVSETFKKIIDKENPQVIHIFGTENIYFYAMMQVADPQKTVINIQGLISKIALYCRNTLPVSVFYGNTFHDMLRFCNPKHIMRNFMKRGNFEQQGLAKAKYIMGRTEWDKAGIYQMAPEAIYFRGGEILRPDFYEKEWSYKCCEKFSIFITNSYAIYKGFHDLLNAMPYILKKYPNAKIYAIGNNPNEIPWYKESTYNRFIRKLIKKYSLKDKIEFVGWLDGKQMAEMLCKVNVMVLPSAIENSPNSLGEAMIVGTPVVAANVGGVTDMLRHSEEGYIYRQNEPFMLAHYICKVFEKGNAVSDFCDMAKRHATEFFDPKNGIKEVLEVYDMILNSNE